MPLSKPRLAQHLNRRIPPSHRSDLAGVLIPEVELQKRIATMGRAIARDYTGRDLLVVSLLSGTVLFLADLLRRLPFPLRVDFLGVSSYGAGTESGNLVFNKELKLDVHGAHVLVVDDILDTGKTLSRLVGEMHKRGAAEVRTCVFLDKPARRAVPFQANFRVFEVEDLFVVGYGLDFAGHYRNLPYVGALKRECYERPRTSAR